MSEKWGPAGVLARFWPAVVLASAVLVLPDQSEAQDLRAGYIVTIAGDSTQGYNGDLDEEGRPRASDGAQLYSPLGLALSPSGTMLYIADSGNHRVRKVETGYWDILTAAGNGSGDYRGDGGQATNASLRATSGLAVDGLGRLFIADKLNHRVRMVDVDQTITTVAGGTKAGYDGDGGVATQAYLKSPEDVVVDGGGVIYISDTGNRRIRIVDPQTGVISTIAGNGKRRRPTEGDDGPALGASFEPYGIALDGSGGLVMVDQYNHRICRLDLDTGHLATIAGSGRGFAGDGDLAEGAKLSRPSGVAVSSTGDIFIADTGNRRVRRISASTGTISTIAGSDSTSYGGDGGRATNAGMSGPYGVAVDQADNVYVSDFFDHRVRRINLRKSSVPQYTIRQPPSRPWWHYLLAFSSVTGGGIYTYVRLTGGPNPLPGPPAFPSSP